jgi:hypothetical protein
MMLELGVALTTQRVLRRALHLMKPELPGVGSCEPRKEKLAAVVLEADQLYRSPRLDGEIRDHSYPAQ